MIQLTRLLLLAGLLSAIAGCTSESSSLASHVGKSSVGSTSTSGGGTSQVRPVGSSTSELITEPSAYGNIVNTGSGSTLYALSADTPSKSTCTGSCLTLWTPVVVPPFPRIGAGLDPKLAGEIDRPDGSHQLTYGGHPLYRYGPDLQPGDINGQAVRSFGGIWLVVLASGKTGAAESQAPSPSHPAGA